MSKTIEVLLFMSGPTKDINALATTVRCATSKNGAFDQAHVQQLASGVSVPAHLAMENINQQAVDTFAHLSPRRLRLIDSNAPITPDTATTATWEIHFRGDEVPNLTIELASIAYPDVFFGCWAVIKNLKAASPHDREMEMTATCEAGQWNYAHREAARNSCP
ncbi:MULTISPECIES: hypothetical protein [Aeromicrobium]|uniref:Uncharacterized protein n=1 Tax=Aeromicrobium fastidiosum TaxID=52699 RepID=A0A641APZ2_9ACTN|nr:MULTISPECIES: hypothetical protein [Aeromicrobium]KAA1378162.1 hypothetical protein ESP62_007215 [Aeromicrobium fastidiosum]MBD8607940.1 hypothetical protein [Aeromicrobium sp. CFBP 8757]MBP2389033.1 hypothetical protein [Aeromicrobium fastidiosum]